MVSRVRNPSKDDQKSMKKHPELWKGCAKWKCVAQGCRAWGFFPSETCLAYPVHDDLEDIRYGCPEGICAEFHFLPVYDAEEPVKFVVCQDCIDEKEISIEEEVEAVMRHRHGKVVTSVMGPHIKRLRLAYDGGLFGGSSPKTPSALDSSSSGASYSEFLPPARNTTAGPSNLYGGDAGYDPNYYQTEGNVDLQGMEMVESQGQENIGSTSNDPNVNISQEGGDKGKDKGKGKADSGSSSKAHKSSSGGSSGRSGRSGRSHGGGGHHGHGRHGRHH